MMADDALQMRARVIDEFSAPLKKLRSELGSIKPPADMGRLRDQMGGLSQAATRAGEAVRSGIGAAMTGLGLGAISATGAIAGAVAALKGFGQQTAELRHFSAEVGLSVQRLREMQAVGQRFGIDDNAMLGGLKKFSGELFDLRRRTGQAYEELLKSGPGGAQLVEQLMGAKTPEEAIGKVLGFLERLPNAMQRQRLGELLFGSGLFGRLGEGGPGSLSKLFEEIGKTIGRVSAEAIEDARRFNEEMRRLSETFNAAFTSVGVKALPHVTDAMKGLADSLKDVDWAEVSKGVAAAFQDVRTAAQDGLALIRELKQLRDGAGLGEKTKEAGGSMLGWLSGWSQLKWLYEKIGPGSPDESRRFVLERSRDELEKRRDDYRKSGDKASEIAAQSKLDRIVEELRKLRESAERGATVQQQSFGGTGGGFSGLIHNASLGGMGGGFSVPRAPAFGGGVGSGGSGMSGVAPRRGAVIRNPAVRNSLNKFGSGLAGDAVDLMAPLEGLHERRDGSTINDFLKRGGVNVKAAFTAWCAGFVNSALAQVGVKGDGSLVAADFRAWGAKVRPDDVRKGDVLVDHRGRQPGQTGAHVGMATGRTRNRNGELEIEMLSGNESDEVRRTFYRARKLDIRRALPEYARNMAKPSETLPIARLGDDMMRRNFAAPKIEGKASLDIRLHGFPKGTTTTPSVEGMFQDVRLDRGRQMAGTDV
jgi:hypothetical protein